MNVLSLFDGMSCGQIALNRCGIKYDNYFASEIDKYAVKVTLANYPKTIQLGDVTLLKGSTLPKIDLLIGGSPCQGFSFAGKQLNFDDPRSKLFFEFVRLLKETSPKWFLLENVLMKKEFQDIISNQLGVEPIMINSNLVSAQNRKRLYWTNIPITHYPVDKGIILSDILYPEYSLNFIDLTKIDNFENLDSLYIKSINSKSIFLDLKIKPPYSFHEARTSIGKLQRKEISKIIGKDFSPRNSTFKEYQILKSYKVNCLTSAKSQFRYIVDLNWEYRELHPIECERLQTVPDNYTNHVSNSQRYKMLGNGWTVDVICHIFSFINPNREINPNEQPIERLSYKTNIF